MASVPNHLYEDIKNHSSVLFAGAGISTEGRLYGWKTFYDTIFEKCGLNDNGETTLSFPELMQHFCDHIDGGNKNRLIREIIDRIESFSAPSGIHNDTTQFHSLVAEIPLFDRIVTTNWDPFFEQALSILVPMFEDRDMGFWHDDKRQVLKIQGFITRPYTIVATKKDYGSCINLNALVWGKLKDLMATKTFLFVGYSMQDSDFHIIFDDIAERLGELRRLSFAIDLNADNASISYWRDRGVQVIKDTGMAMMIKIRDRLVEEDIIPSHTYLHFLAKEFNRIAKIHYSLDQNECDGAISSAMYQDGLMHALNEVQTTVRTGNAKDNLLVLRDIYERNAEKYLAVDNFVEYAYTMGWVVVLRHFAARSSKRIPIFFHPSRLIPVNRYVK